MVVNSSTLNSERSEAESKILKSRSVRILALSVALLLGFDLSIKALTHEPNIRQDNSSLLQVQPRDGSVYLFGNSMFKTGVNVEYLNTLLGGIPADFEYHNGHYTNLWYLIAKSALGYTEETPAVVVWGFRPKMALDPAFRQNQANNTDLFAIDDPNYNALKVGEDFSDPDIFSADYVRQLLDNNSGLHSNREDFQERIRSLSNQVGLEILDALSIDSVKNLKISLNEDGRSLADEIAQAVTGGAISLTEENVVDTSGDFIIGPQKEFSDGYIPLIAQTIQNLGIPQIVVIWRQVNVARGEPIDAENRFTEDALTFFSEEDIPVLNLYNNTSISEDLFASGDHYNESGRILITELLANTLLNFLNK